MTRTVFILRVAIAAVLSVGGAHTTVADDLPAVWSGDISPVELHRELGKQKAIALDRTRRAQRLAAGEQATSQTDYDVKWYDITIRVNDTTEYLYGTVSIIAEAVVDGLTEVEIDYAAGMNVISIEAGSGPLAYSRNGDVVTVTLEATYNTGEQFAFDFIYDGQPETGGFQAFSFGWHGGKRAISSLSEPYFARSWWPCKDRMDDKPDSIGIHIEVDSSLYCASNGTLDSTTTVPLSNSHTFHYTCHYPIATYLFSVAIAPYIVWEQTYWYNEGQNSLPIIHHVYSDWYDYSLGTWGLTPTMMLHLEGAFGPYPFLDDKYGHANFNWGGGMEHQTVTSMVGSEFGFYWAVVVHELGHQWWGDMVTCKSWEDIWLNEGWASYSEAVYRLSTGDWTAYHNYMNLMDYKGGGTVWVSDTTNVWQIFNGNLSYDKGAWLVHMLRGVLGEELFAAGLEAYYHEFQYDAATTAEFRTLWENTTGVDLQAYFDQWFYGEYYPAYNYFYMDEPSDSGGYDVYLVVKQYQTTQPRVFEMPVDFFFDYVSMEDDTLTLVIDERAEFFKFNLPSQVAQIKLDPSDWILKDAYNYPWQMFIITLDHELSDGVVGQPYLDTIETRGGTGPNLYNISSGFLPPGLSVTGDGIISGTPTTEGVFPFTIGFANPSTGYSDQRWFDIEIFETPCCTGKVGDVNNLGGDEPTIGDVSLLIDMLFINGNVPDCLTEADVNQSGGAEPTVDDITIGDIAVLIDHLYISGVELADCL